MASTSLNISSTYQFKLPVICQVLSKELGESFKVIKTYADYGEIIFILKSSSYQIVIKEFDLQYKQLTIEYIRQEYPELFI